MAVGDEGHLTAIWQAQPTQDDPARLYISVNKPQVTKHYYTSGGNQRIATRVAGQVYYIHSDHLGSTTLLTDESGNEVSRIHYSPYGSIIESSGSLPTDRLYTGQRREESIGLYDYRARFYDPYLNQFISPDPIIPDLANPQSWNRYAYVFNNPVRYSDPSGHCPGCGRMLVDVGIGGGYSVPTPRIISRSEWGAIAPATPPALCGGLGSCVTPGWSEGFFDPDNPEVTSDGYRTYPDLGYTSLSEGLFEIVIHHSGNSPIYDIRKLQYQHMFERGMTDIGYHFVIDPSGIIYEGRDIGVRGNHAYGNTGRVGVLLMGDFEPGDEIKRFGMTFHIPEGLDRYGPPTDKQIEGATVLIRYLDAKYGIQSVVGHQHVPENYTDCPGQLCLPYIPMLNDVARER